MIFLGLTGLDCRWFGTIGLASQRIACPSISFSPLGRLIPELPRRFEIEIPGIPDHREREHGTSQILAERQSVQRLRVVP